MFHEAELGKNWESEKKTVSKLLGPMPNLRQRSNDLIHRSALLESQLEKLSYEDPMGYKQAMRRRPHLRAIKECQMASSL